MRGIKSEAAGPGVTLAVCLRESASGVVSAAVLHFQVIQRGGYDEYGNMSK